MAGQLLSKLFPTRFRTIRTEKWNKHMGPIGLNSSQLFVLNETRDNISVYSKVDLTFLHEIKLECETTNWAVNENYLMYHAIEYIYSIIDFKTGNLIDSLDYSQVGNPRPFAICKDHIYGLHDSSISGYSMNTKKLKTYEIPEIYRPFSFVPLDDGILRILVWEDTRLCLLVISFCDDKILINEKFLFDPIPNVEYVVFRLENFIIFLEEVYALVLTLEGKLLFKFPCPEWRYMDCWEDEIFILSKDGISIAKFG